MIIAVSLVSVYSDTSATDLLVRDTTVYVGGEQTPSSGPAGSGISIYATQQDKWSSFNWGCDGGVRAVQIFDGYAYLAGDFGACDNHRMGPFAIYDIDREQFMSPLGDGQSWEYSWDVAGETWDKQIETLEVHDGIVYLGGQFRLHIGADDYANNFVSYDPRTGTFKSYGRGLNGKVHSIFVQDARTIFLGGTFTRVGQVNDEDSLVRPETGLLSPYWTVWHEDHELYGTGYGDYPLGVEQNDFADGDDWVLDGPVRRIWRGLVQMEPNGDVLNPITKAPFAPKLTLILVGDFTGGVIYQQDDHYWRRADGGLWGGRVRDLAHLEKENAFLFVGSFSSAGHWNATNEEYVAANGFVRWNYQNNVPRGGRPFGQHLTDYPPTRGERYPQKLPEHFSNSHHQKIFDGYENVLPEGSEVYSVAVEQIDGLAVLAGDFNVVGQFQNLVGFDFVKRTYDKFGNGDEFSATLYTAIIGVRQQKWSEWGGVWTDNTHFGAELHICVSGFKAVGTFGVGVFEGSVTPDGRGISGVYYLAGYNSIGNWGYFGLRLSTGNNGFTGWYSVDGQNGRWEWNEERLSSDRPSLYECNDVNRGSGGNLAATWVSGAQTISLCIISDDVYGSTSDGRWYWGKQRHGGKTAQLQFIDDEGFGVAMFRQTEENRAVESWFRGDYRDIKVSNCEEVGDCIIGKVWSRTEFDATDAECQTQQDNAAWVGSFYESRNDNVIYLQQSGDQIRGHGATSLFLGDIDPDNSNHATGTWIYAGWGEKVGVLRGSFDIMLNDEGRTIEGILSILENYDGNPIDSDDDGVSDSIDFNWRMTRVSSTFPDGELVMSPGWDYVGVATILDGRWEREEDGMIVDICSINPNGGRKKARVEGSRSDGRYFKGDLFNDNLERVYETANFEDLSIASFSYENPKGKNGVGLYRRVGYDTIQEVWMAGNPADNAVSECDSDTCQLTDRGSTSTVYRYVGPTTERDCKANA